jgi:hypothetical protein
MIFLLFSFDILADICEAMGIQERQGEKAPKGNSESLGAVT